MKVIAPIDITDANLVSSSIPETDESEWASGVTYAAGDRVMVLSVHAVFESAINGNTGNDPVADDGTNWVLIQATNRWSVFDKQIDNPATSSGTITYVLTSADLISGIALFGLIGSELTLTIESGGQSQVYTRTLYEQSNVTGWFSYFFGGFDQLETVVFTNLPVYNADTTYTIEVTPIAGVAAIGQLVLGAVRELGFTRWQSEISIVSGSTRQRNVFLDFIVVKRATALRVKFRVLVLKNRVSTIIQEVRKFDALPAVWIGDDDGGYGLIIYGLPFDYTHSVDLDNKSEYKLTIEGLK